MIRRYQVVVTEYLRQNIEIEAESEEKAHEKAMAAWLNGDIRLDGRDYDGGDVYVIGEHSLVEGDEACDYIFH